MTFAEAKVFYKTNKAIAKVLDLSEGRVSQLKTEGGFQYPEQCVLQIDSDGELIARKEDEPSDSKHAA